MTPISVANVRKYTYFIYNHSKFIQNVKIEDGTLNKEAFDIIDLYEYHPAKCGEGAFETLGYMVKFIPITMMMKKKTKMMF